MSLCCRFISIFIFLIYEAVLAQTDSLNIYWDPPEDDNVAEYRLYRKVDNNPFELFWTGSETHTIDTSSVIEPGRLIIYQVTAVDDSLRESGPSNQDSAAIPEVSQLNWYINANASTAIFLVDIISDPHPNRDILALNIDTVNVDPNLQISFNDPRTEIILFPIISSGTLNFDLKVEAKEMNKEFWDQKTITVTVTDIDFGETILVEWSDEQEQLHVEVTTVILSKVKMDYWINPLDVNSFQTDVYANSHSFDIGSLVPDTLYSFTLSLEDITGFTLVVLDSTFQTGSAAIDENEVEVIVFPNPFRLGHELVIFEPLPVEASEIMVFTTAGVLVYNQNVDGSRVRRWEWKVINNDKQNLASGVYIYIIKGKNGKKLQSGKLAVIR